LGVVFAALCICSVVQSARKWGIRRRGMQPRHRAGMLLQLPVVMARGFYRPAFLLLGAEMLFFLSIAVFTVYPVNLLGWLLTYPFRGAGKFIQHLGMIRLAKWIHRLGSVMVVLPTH